MSDLKLLALDVEDLEVIATHVQDSLLYVRDIDFSASNKQLNLAVNRCHHEAKVGANRAQRSHAGLAFSHVTQIQVQNIDRSDPDLLLSLLNVEFKITDSPEGLIELIFANGSTIKLTVDCLEVHLADLGESWISDAKPKHKL